MRRLQQASSPSAAPVSLCPSMVAADEAVDPSRVEWHQLLRMQANKPTHVIEHVSGR